MGRKPKNKIIAITKNSSPPLLVEGLKVGDLYLLMYANVIIATITRYIYWYIDAK